MVLIDEILIDEELLTEKFCCNLEACKGACCTFPGEFGAPVLDEEKALIEAYYPYVKKYLSKKSIDYIEYNGLVEGRKGNLTTVCINKRDCVLVYYEGKIAFCALEKAFKSGEIPFRKPLSCHLFPIRVKNFGGKYLYYSVIDECKPAKTFGEKNNILLLDSLKDSIVRAYGEQWYSFLKSYIEQTAKQEE
jgi:hypothetical protein